MEQLRKEPTEVLIVGAGPSGLMMACQLAIHQVPFRIIDKNEYSSKSSGALILQARSLEILDQMGIAGDALKGGIIAGKINILFNGKKVVSTDIRDIGKDLSRFPFLLMLEQSETEKLFLNFINERGHSVERGTLFKSLIHEPGGVTSVLILPDGSEQTIKTKYLIAADGANSSVRSFLNIPFKGRTYPEPFFILDCKAKTDLDPGEIYFAFTKTSTAAFFPLPGSRWRIDSDLPKEPSMRDAVTFDTIDKDFRLWKR